MKIPHHLSEHSAKGLTVGEPVAQFEMGKYQNFVYLVLDWQEKKAAIIDPQKDLTPLLEALNQHQFQLEGIILTHTHYDHVEGLPSLHKQFPTIPIYVHHGDFHRIQEMISEKSRPEVIRNISDGDQIFIGKTTIDVIHTPGHSAGECSYFLRSTPPHLFTGDTVFIRDCGRTDMETGDTAQMFESLQRLKKLPLETVILPGHHYQPECASTLAQEMKESAPFRCANVDELAALP